MMMSEFIERTGFEPTEEEYRTIEEEYMGGREDKDAFCKQWKKNGGVQRLTKARKYRIENLESTVYSLERQKANLVHDLRSANAELSETRNEAGNLELRVESYMKELEKCRAEIESLKSYSEELNNRIAEYRKSDEQLAAIKNLIAVLQS